MQRLMLCKNFLVTSSLMIWASLSWSFSRAERSCMPTMVTPMGHALHPEVEIISDKVSMGWFRKEEGKRTYAFPMDSRR